jgi:integrase/recombinase XerD
MIMENWEEYLQARYSPTTVRAYVDEMRRFSKAHANLTTVTAGDISAYVTSYGHRAPATVRRIISVLRSFYEWAIQDGLVEQSPLVGVKGPRQGGRRLPRSLNEEEVSRLLEADHGHRAHLMLILMLYGGLRLREVSSMRWQAINWPGKALLIRGKGDKERIVPIHDNLLEALRSWRDKAVKKRPGDPLFPGYRGQALRPRSIEKIVLRAGETAGLERRLTPHMLRHTFATRLLGAGVGIRVIQVLLGHASIATTQIYTHVSDRQMKLAVDML